MCYRRLVGQTDQWTEFWILHNCCRIKMILAASLFSGLLGSLTFHCKWFTWVKIICIRSLPRWIWMDKKIFTLHLMWTRAITQWDIWLACKKYGCASGLVNQLVSLLLLFLEHQQMIWKEDICTLYTVQLSRKNLFLRRVLWGHDRWCTQYLSWVHSSDH